MTPTMRTSTRVDFSGSRSTEPSLPRRGSRALGLPGLRIVGVGRSPGEQRHGGEHRDQHAEDDAARPLCGASGVSKIRIALAPTLPTDAAGVERSIGNGREGNSKRAFPSRP
jgi:hypothetical protein